MKTRGFTLIELLAVIVILAIIALIATPIVLDIISDSKKNVEEINIKNIKHSMELYVAQEELNGNLNKSGNIYEEVVKNIKGEKPDNGIIYVNNSGDMALALKYGNKCYTKKYSSEEIKVEETDTCIVPVDYLMINPNVSSDATTFLGDSKINRNQVESITTVDTIENIPSGIYSWDVSSEESEKGSVMAWYYDEDSDGLYELYIGQEGGVKANPDSSNLFAYFVNVTYMDLSNLDTSNATTMYGVFNQCQTLEKLDVSKFNTSQVTDMTGMFNSCISLTSLDLSSFDTSNVTTMLVMFNQCNSLENLNLSSFNTSNVTTMRTMFQKCTKLTQLNLNNFDTSNVEDMSYMFNQCNNLSELKINNFDTSKVTTMRTMFQGCNKLIELNLSSFDTSNLIDTAGMFNYCSSLTKLNMQKATLKNVTTYGSMFVGVTSLTKVIIEDEVSANWLKNTAGLPSSVTITKIDQ